MDHILHSLQYPFWFVVMLTIVVFIHEFGHYITARLNGVKIDVFSIGFGPEIFGYTDKQATRWKFSAIPVGGYVKMFGDRDPSSQADTDKLEEMSYKEKQVSFHFKSLKQKAAVVFAGPAFNYLSAIIILSGLLMWHGKSMTDPIISSVLPDSPAQEAGLKPNDTVLEVNDSSIESFEDVRQIIAFNTTEPLKFLVERNGNELEVIVTPKMQDMVDGFGNKIQMPIIGISSDKTHIKYLSFFPAIGESINQTITISIGMLKALGQIIVGERSFSQLGGPVKIAQYSGQSAQSGIVPFLWFIAMISINLGLLNLFPLPVLDGGHLFFYTLEWLRGKPIDVKFQAMAMQVTLALLALLMIVITVNDIRSLFN